jgi:ADP-ribose pyrophosphatase YjhB (NUDIX family)/adenosine deaminase
LLETAGIRAGSGPQVRLAALSPAVRDTLAARLALPVDRQSTFAGLERVYALRGPIARRVDLFEPLLRQVARDYAAMGVKYVELSHGTIEQAAWLRVAERVVEPLEAETGVRIRFLLGIHRANDPEWNLDLLERLESLAGSRALVGIDVMGHETSSTRTFAGVLARVADWAHRNRPGFVVRVHAGENPAFPENVRVAAESVRSRDVSLRIGHGLYGGDPETLDLLRSMDAVVEFNPNSNFALNNIQSCAELPITSVVAAKVRCVLGTDGYGIYGTDLAAEVRAASLSGLDDAALGWIVDSERHVLARRGADPNAPFEVPDDPPLRFFTPEADARKRSARVARDESLRAAVEAAGITWLEDAALDALVTGRRLISVAGAWRGAFALLSDAERERIRSVVAAFVAGLDPATHVLLTGGTRHGVEGEVHGHAKNMGIPVIATLVRATPVTALDPAVTHAWPCAEHPHDKAAPLYALAKRHDALCLFLGGGNVVNDEIQAASNLRVRYLLLDDVGGASGHHASNKPHRAFHTAADALAKIDDSRFFSAAFEPFWHLGPNPTVDLATFRTNATTGSRELLLIRRHDDAPTETGQWALPGGFVTTDAPRGTPWRPGFESTHAAAVRELAEETGLDLADLPELLQLVGEFEGGGRDPRDTPTAWSRTFLFVVDLPPAVAARAVVGGDDAADARWWPVSALPARLAFDHARLFRCALEWLSGP